MVMREGEQNRTVADTRMNTNRYICVIQCIIHSNNNINNKSEYMHFIILYIFHFFSLFKNNTIWNNITPPLICTLLFCSSRSHQVLMLRVEGYDRVSKATSHGRLTLVDLAGSERISRSEATGIRLVEAAAINKSLSALGQVFRMLNIAISIFGLYAYIY